MHVVKGHPTVLKAGTVHVRRPVESHSGAQESLSLCRITTSLRMRRDRDAEGVEKARNVGRVSPHHPTRVLKEHRKLPQRGRQERPADARVTRDSASI